MVESVKNSHYLFYVSTFSDLKSKISLICDKVKLKIHFPYEAYIKAADYISVNKQLKYYLSHIYHSL